MLDGSNLKGYVFKRFFIFFNLGSKLYIRRKNEAELIRFKVSKVDEESEDFSFLSDVRNSMLDVNV